MSLLLPCTSSPRGRSRRTRDPDEEAAVAGGWPHLPLDLFALVACRISDRGDFVRFSAACKSYARLSSSLPLLRLRWDAPSLAHLYPHIGKMRHLLPLHRSRDDPSPSSSPPPPLVRLHAPRCFMVGCSRGLLLLFDHLYRFSLLDPRTGAVTPLPQPHFPRAIEIVVSEPGDVRYFTKGYLDKDFEVMEDSAPQWLSLSSSDPANCVALCFYPRLKHFIYWRSGDDGWARLPLRDEPVLIGPSHLYHQGHFYFLSYSSLKVYVCNIGASSSAVQVRSIPISPASIELVRKFALQYKDPWLQLVECQGDMIVLLGDCPLLDSDRGSSFRWRLFRLDMSKEEAEWGEVRDIGCHALFIGINEPFSLSTRDFPGFEPNCIYICNLSCNRQRSDYVVCNIKSQTTKVVFFEGVAWPGQSSLRRFWIAPRRMS